MISDDIAHTASLHAPCQLHVARQRVFDFDKLLETVMKLTLGRTKKIVHPKAHMRHIYIFKAVFPAVFFVPYEDLPP
jgi:hypothetical protein